MLFISWQQGGENFQNNKMTAGFCNLLNRIIEKAACYGFLSEELKLIHQHFTQSTPPVSLCIKFTFRDFRFLDKIETYKN